MATKKRGNKPKKHKAKVKIAQNAVIRKKKNVAANDTIKKARTQLPRDNGANFKITIKKKRN